MSRVSVNKLGRVGVVRDIFSHDTPPEAWTSIRNGRMGPYGAEIFLGHTKTLGTDSAGWAVPVYSHFFAPVVGSGAFWVGAGQNKIYARTASSPYTETNITRQSGGLDVNYSATEGKKWAGGMFGGLLLINNTFDEPQVWAPKSGGGTKLVNLSTFGTGPWPTNYRCGVMRGFGRFLVAIDITKAGTRYEQLVKWSHPSDPNTMPGSWDPTDATVDAGEFPLADAQGGLVDMRTLRGVNVLYTTDQAWEMRHTGGGDIMGFSPLFEQGALAVDCVAKFKNNGEFHFVMCGDDIYIHNGQSIKSVITPAMRRWFFQQVDPTYFNRSFVVANPRYSEMWACVPENGSEQPTLALVWNWETGAVGFRDLLKESSGSDTRTTAATKGTPSIASGVLEDITTESWSGDPGTWDNDATLWDEALTSPMITRLVMADRSAGKRSFLADSSNGFDGGNITFEGERVGLTLGGEETSTELVMLLTEFWPRFEAPAGSVFTINFAKQDAPDTPPTWSSDYTYTVGAKSFVSCYESGRYLGVRIRHASTGAVRLLGYAMELGSAGSF